MAAELAGSYQESDEHVPLIVRMDMTDCGLTLDSVMFQSQMYDIYSWVHVHVHACTPHETVLLWILSYI